MTAKLESPAIRWYGDRLALLDQRLLPRETRWLELASAESVADAIRDMVVRGAPAIGIAAAYGVVLAARGLGERASAESLAPALDILAASRPTAVNLFWALARMKAAITTSGTALIETLTAEAEAVHNEDRRMNLRLAEHGLALVPDGCAIYTHCNTGALATGGHAVGIALGHGPAFGLQHLLHHASVRSRKRCSLPVSVRGSVVRNSTARGYL